MGPPACAESTAAGDPEEASESQGGEGGGLSGSDASCIETSRTVADDEPSEIELTVNEVLARYHVGEGSWRCPLHWAVRGEQVEASWTPHDASTVVAARVTRGSEAARVVTGRAPPGTRLACPPRLDLPFVVELSTEDGGLSETWTTTGSFLPWSDDLSISFDPHAAGGFAGEYRFELLAPSEWAQSRTLVSLSHPFGALEGALIESAERPSSPGAKKGDSQTGEGFMVRSAVWQCDSGGFHAERRSDPAPG